MLVKYACIVEFYHGGKKHIQRFTVETELSSGSLQHDIIKQYQRHFRYTIDGRLIDVTVEVA